MKLGQKVLGKALFGLLMKQTFYGHFVAGEDQERIKPIIGRMQSFGVKSILDYSVEVDESESKEDKKQFKKVQSQKFFDFVLIKNAFEKVSEVKESDTLNQYTPLDEDENKEIDRKANLNSARTFFYAGEKECDANMKVFLDCIDAVKGETNY